MVSYLMNIFFVHVTAHVVYTVGCGGGKVELSLISIHLFGLDDVDDDDESIATRRKQNSILHQPCHQVSQYMLFPFGDGRDRVQSSVSTLPPCLVDFVRARGRQPHGERKKRV